MVSAVKDKITSFFKKRCAYRSCAFCRHFFPETMLKEERCELCSLTHKTN